MFALYFKGSLNSVVHYFSPVHAAPSIALLLQVQTLSLCFFSPIPKAEDHLNVACRAVSLGSIPRHGTGWKPASGGCGERGEMGSMEKKNKTPQRS